MTQVAGGRSVLVLKLNWGGAGVLHASQHSIHQLLDLITGSENKTGYSTSPCPYTCIFAELHSFFSLLPLGDIVGKLKTYLLKWSGMDIAEIQKGEKSNFQLSLPNWHWRNSPEKQSLFAFQDLGFFFFPSKESFWESPVYVTVKMQFCPLTQTGGRSHWPRIGEGSKGKSPDERLKCCPRWASHCCHSSWLLRSGTRMQIDPSEGLGF